MHHHLRAHLEVPVVEVNDLGQIIGISSTKINYDPTAYMASLRMGFATKARSELAATATVTPGSLDGGEDGDLIAVNLTAGVTYTWNLRGAAGGVEDPYLFLLNSAFGTISFDDDGGFGLSSMITYTPTTSGTYYLYATSFDGGAVDDGGYTIAQWSPEADVPGSTNILASLGTAVQITAGTYYGNMDFINDNDYFKLDVEAGFVYAFAYSGGVSGLADRNGEAGETLAQIYIYNAAGQQLSTNFNYESGTSYVATTNTTIYVRLRASTEPGAGGTGGYTLDIDKIDPTTRDPLESLNWDNAANITPVVVDGVKTAYVYFGAAGETFGETTSTGAPLPTFGWNEIEKAAVMQALAQYTPITGIKYEITTDVNQATFRLATTKGGGFGAYMYPQDPVYGTQKGIGVFNVDSGGWDKPGVSTQNLPGDQVSLLQGGFAFGVILHEFGHAHGIAHPHDRGGGSEVMLGVTAPTDSYGVYNLNQGVYTVMSYNDAWDFHPDGPSAFTIAGIDNGWSGTLSAFDIAVLQARYGVHAYNGGNNTYALTDVTDDAFYQTIWDSGGDDTIAYGGALNAQIDLTAATLDYTPTGGGVVSFLYNAQPTTTGPGGNNSFQVRGGYTIANGVVIENATGGSGNDILLGNSAANVLTGNDGNDTLMGRGGNDTLDGGVGNDTLKGGDGNDRIIGGIGADKVYGGDGLDVVTLGANDDIFVAEIGATKQTLKTGTMSVDIITDFDAAGLGNDVIDLSEIGQTFTFKGTNANKNAGDLTYKTYTSVNGAENALGFDIDGQSGASGISGPVTVVYGNIDGGAADFAIILLNTASVDASDFLFG